MRDVLVKLSDGNVQGNSGRNYESQYQLAAGQRENVRPRRQLQRQDADRQYHRQQRRVRRVAVVAQRVGCIVYGIATFGGSALYGCDQPSPADADGRRAQRIAALITASAARSSRR